MNPLKRKYISLSNAALEFPDIETLLLVIKEERLRLRGRHTSQWHRRPAAPADISAETVHNSEIFIDDDRLVIEDDFVEGEGFIDNGCYIDLQVYAQDLDKVLRELRSLKRGPKFKYNWVEIRAHAQDVAKTWKGSQNKFLESMGSWIADRHKGNQPDRAHLLRKVGDIFQKAEARRKGSA